jgi:Nucleoside 2-deoxyribosyltransferase
VSVSPSMFAFVLMPFSNEFDDIYKYGIKETAESLDMVAERVDEQIYSEGILERIYRQIETADLVIADMTNQNPNVFYEVGYAHAKGKQCILLTQRSDDIPFDLKHHRHIVYGASIFELKNKLFADLKWAKTQIEIAKTSWLKVTLKELYGTLEKNNYLAWGSTKFTFDLHNESDNTLSDLDAIYVYVGDGWTFSCDGKECPSTESDLPIYARRHFFSPPVSRLNKNSWAQLKFSGRKLLASAIGGEELKDEYTISGKVLVRLVTSSSKFDYEMQVQVQFYDLPF